MSRYLLVSATCIGGLVVMAMMFRKRVGRDFLEAFYEGQRARNGAGFGC